MKKLESRPDPVLHLNPLEELEKLADKKREEREAREIHNTANLPNYHVLSAAYIGPSNTKPSRIKIYSARFKQGVVFSYGDSGGTLEQAETWLIKNGHKVIGHGEGYGVYYIICAAVNGSFKPLK